MQHGDSDTTNDARSADRLPMAGKSVLVTGGARRIGAAICAHLHQLGANVIVHCARSLETAQALATQLETRRADSAYVVQGELGSRDIAERIAEEIGERSQRLDLLDNNASSFFPTPVGDIGEAEWANLVDSNLKGPLFLSQALYPLLASAEGSVVNIADIYAFRPLRGHAVYNVAKAGNVMLTQTLALEFAPRVRVNGIAPGAILWPESDSADAESLSARVAAIPLQRKGEPDDIAAAVAYLASAGYVTGQVLAVDGGRSLLT